MFIRHREALNEYRSTNHLFKVGDRVRWKHTNIIYRVCAFYPDYGIRNIALSDGGVAFWADARQCEIVS